MAVRAFRRTNLALAFLLGLCALTALGYWGVRTGDGMPARAALGFAAPLLAAVLWGMFAAPRAPAASPRLELGTHLAVFGSAALAPYSTGQSHLASDFAVNGNLVRFQGWGRGSERPARRR